MGEYVPPFATIWTSESLDGIEAEMSYGCSYNVCNHACQYTSCPSYSSSCTAYCLSYSSCSYTTCSTYGSSGGSSATQYPSQNDGWASATSAYTTYEFTAHGAVDVECSADNSYIYLVIGGEITQVEEDYLKTVAAEEAQARCSVIVSSKSGEAIYSKLRHDTHLDTNSEFYSTGAIWKHIDGIPASGHIPSEIIYLTTDTVDALKQLIRDDRQLEFWQTLYEGGAQLAFDFVSSCYYSKPFIGAIGFFIGVYLSTTTPSAEKTLNELEANYSSFPRGIRTYRYLDGGSIPRYEFEAWDSSSTMRGVPGALGGWTAIPCFEGVTP